MLRVLDIGYTNLKMAMGAKVKLHSSSCRWVAGPGTDASTTVNWRRGGTCIQVVIDGEIGSWRVEPDRYCKDGSVKLQRLSSPTNPNKASYVVP